jgi:TonB family protein
MVQGMGAPEKIPPVSNPSSFVFAGWIFAIVVLVGGGFGGVALWRRAKSASQEVRARVAEAVKSKPRAVPMIAPPVVPTVPEPEETPTPAPVPSAQPGQLGRESIQRVVQRHLREVKYCYETGLKRHPRLAGRLKVRFTINPKGRVVSSERLSSTLGNATVESCVLKATRRWVFPAPADGKPLKVVYPFVFSS